MVTPQCRVDFFCDPYIGLGQMQVLYSPGRSSSESGMAFTRSGMRLLTNITESRSACPLSTQAGENHFSHSHEASLTRSNPLSSSSDFTRSRVLNGLKAYVDVDIGLSHKVTVAPRDLLVFGLAEDFLEEFPPWHLSCVLRS